jgi:hypothetical protein
MIDYFLSLMITKVLKVIFIEVLWSLYLQYFIEVTGSRNLPPIYPHGGVLVEYIATNVLNIHPLLLP